MKSKLNLKPGQKGTKKLVEKYGKSLLYVRYRYDESREVRLTTVELIVEEKPWKPLDAKLVRVQVGFSEIQLRDRLKAAGGKWHPEEKLWYIPYGAIRDTELEERIMAEDRKGKRRS